ncbi:unnamed protein product [Rotaria magnacalcarata]|uniref:SOCS box domain-containing protein n=3 Tax=Rotaria magnacalcarata TaxID=392030 RepID=A0A820CTT4_9BILA|nr:unnamed protein product [Rotaria magnacalcarata]CAF2193942.1 unnamed protein product [Rotaria magnacalcarata]CAF4226390.1 unnamed protein product [Rotaria magnacalcarata]CAF4254321.1 unnamed protein product [Rotaria magnacalcarata]
MLPAHRSVTQYNIDDQLIVAIIQHDLSTVRHILESNRYSSTINQSLFYCSYRDDFNHPLTPLAAACHFGSYDIVDILINYFHANINKQHLPGCKTPLHYAVLAKSNRSNIVQYLLGHGASVDIQDRHGTTALMLAVLHSYDDIVHLLLEQAGANVRIYNQYHLTAFDFVKTNTSIINNLIRYGTISFNINNKKLFQWLIINKHMRLARLLIEAGYTPPITSFQQRIRSLKSLCRLKVRFQISGSHFRQRIETLPVKNKQLIKYILLDDI